MTANFQVSGKTNNNGIIFVVGGETIDEFGLNLQALLGDRAAVDDALAEFAQLVVPTSSGGTAQPQAAQQPPPQQSSGFARGGQQQQQSQPDYNAQRQPDTGPPPGQQNPYCEGNGHPPAPAKWVPPGTSRAGKPYSGFYACNVSRQGDPKCRVNN